MAGKLQLPPLQVLVVFEAAARHGNFTAAGNELGPYPAGGQPTYSDAGEFT